MKRWHIGFVFVLIVGMLVGCGGGETASESADESSGETYTSAAIDTSYDGALDASSQLMLGTLKLEETANAVTSEQAKTLLPLWQALRGGVTAQAEMNAVLKQIEGTMTQEQLAAIAAMQLTQEDLRAWMEEQGPGMGGGFPRPDEDMSEEERESLRETRQAQSGGGEGMPGMPGGGEMPPEMATRRAEFENMSDEEREEMRATMQAGGRGGAGGGQFVFLLNPLLELLETRAAES